MNATSLKHNNIVIKANMFLAATFLYGLYRISYSPNQGGS